MDVAPAHEVATRLAAVVHERGIVTVISVGGELDAWTAPALCRHVEESVEAGAPSVLIDLTDAQLCDQDAVRALAGAVHQARAHKALVRVLRPGFPDVGRAFDDADGLGRLPVAGDAEQALRELS
jgi:anti-anti-sigma factor